MDVWREKAQSFCPRHEQNTLHCFHGNRKHSALAAYSPWNPGVSAQAQLTFFFSSFFPIERADVCSCLFADVRTGQKGRMME